MVSIQGSVNYSDGANSYMWRSGENYYAADAYVNPNNGDVETISTYGATLGTSIKLGGSQPSASSWSSCCEYNPPVR